MKQNENFLLKEIAGVPYLLPFGQMIADHKRGLKTNATGVFLWNLLKENLSLDEVLSRSAVHYEIPASELSSFQSEIALFLDRLLSLGILVDSDEQKNAGNTPAQIQASRNTVLAHMQPPTSFMPTEHLLSIGGLTLKLILPSNALPPEFTDFLITNETTVINQTIVLHSELPTEALSGHTLLHNHELNIIEQEAQYLLHFGLADRHLEIHLSKDGSTAHCYCLPPYDAQFHYDFFHAIRLIYLYLAQRHGMVVLHSASILYKDKLWLFSGHSGMGKSTHTNLWKEYFNAPVINGDLNLLAIENGQPVVHGIPWCGTSELYDTKSYPLGGIILLNKAPENIIEQLTPDKKRLLVSQRLISPVWTKELWNANLDIIEPWIDNVMICKLHCTKEKDAAEIMKNEIDKFLK